MCKAESNKGHESQWTLEIISLSSMQIYIKNPLFHLLVWQNSQNLKWIISGHGKGIGEAAVSLLAKVKFGNIKEMS